MLSAQQHGWFFLRVVRGRRGGCVLSRNEGDGDGLAFVDATSDFVGVCVYDDLE
jgi:hypothetical protein